MLKTKEDILRGKAGFTNEGVDLAEIRGSKQHVVAHPGCSLVGRKWGGDPNTSGKRGGALFFGIPEGSSQLRCLDLLLQAAPPAWSFTPS